MVPVTIRLPTGLNHTPVVSQDVRLLFVVNDPAFFLSHRVPLARAAKAAGFEVHVATPAGKAADLIRSEFPFHPIALRRGGRNLVAELRTLASLARVFRRVRPTIVHAVTIKPVLYAGLLSQVFGVASLSAISGLGYIFLARGTTAAATRMLVRFAYRLALRKSRVIFQNEADRALFEQLGCVSHEQTLLIRGSGVDLDAFPLQPEPLGRPVVMLPSRLLWDKGVGEFVAAARTLCGQARFVMVGDIDEQNPAHVPRVQVDAWAKEGVVEWWGFGSDMPRTLALSNIVVLPSYREGLPKVLLEAAATGRAIVTTDVPGCRDAVRPGETALLVPVRDSKALAAALSRLLRSKEQRLSLGLAGRRLVEAEFSVEKVAAETLALYRALLKP